jgi:hypothetical protein
MQTMDAIHQPLFNDVEELRGQVHRSRQSAVSICTLWHRSGASAGVLWEERVVLKAPPDTDAVECDFHMGVERLDLNRIGLARILLRGMDVIIGTNVTFLNTHLSYKIQ